MATTSKLQEKDIKFTKKMEDYSIIEDSDDIIEGSDDGKLKRIFNPVRMDSYINPDAEITAWDATKTYNKGDLVYFYMNMDGMPIEMKTAQFISIADNNVGNMPFNPQYWWGYRNTKFGLSVDDALDPNDSQEGLVIGTNNSSPTKSIIVGNGNFNRQGAISFDQSKFGRLRTIDINNQEEVNTLILGLDIVYSSGDFYLYTSDPVTDLSSQRQITFPSAVSMLFSSLEDKSYIFLVNLDDMEVGIPILNSVFCYGPKLDVGYPKSMLALDMINYADSSTPLGDTEAIFPNLPTGVCIITKESEVLTSCLQNLLTFAKGNDIYSVLNEMSSVIKIFANCNFDTMMCYLGLEFGPEMGQDFFPKGIPSWSNLFPSLISGSLSGGMGGITSGVGLFSTEFGTNNFGFFNAYGNIAPFETYKGGGLKPPYAFPSNKNKGGFTPGCNTRQFFMTGMSIPTPKLFDISETYSKGDFVVSPTNLNIKLNGIETDTYSNFLDNLERIDYTYEKLALKSGDRFDPIYKEEVFYIPFDIFFSVANNNTGNKIESFDYFTPAEYLFRINYHPTSSSTTNVYKKGQLIYCEDTKFYYLLDNFDCNTGEPIDPALQPIIFREITSKLYLYDVSQGYTPGDIIYNNSSDLNPYICIANATGEPLSNGDYFTSLYKLIAGPADYPSVTITDYANNTTFSMGDLVKGNRFNTLLNYNLKLSTIYRVIEDIYDRDILNQVNYTKYVVSISNYMERGYLNIKTAEKLAKPLELYTSDTIYAVKQDNTTGQALSNTDYFIPVLDTPGRLYVTKGGFCSARTDGIGIKDKVRYPFTSTPVSGKWNISLTVKTDIEVIYAANIQFTIKTRNIDYEFSEPKVDVIYCKYPTITDLKPYIDFHNNELNNFEFVLDTHLIDSNSPVYYFASVTIDNALPTNK